MQINREVVRDIINRCIDFYCHDEIHIDSDYYYTISSTDMMAKDNPPDPVLGSIEWEVPNLIESANQEDIPPSLVDFERVLNLLKVYLGEY